MPVMSTFRPTRASPPSKPPSIVQSNLSEISRSSAVSVPELTGLTSEDVDILDAVVERAGPSSTTFLTVFKAYNDVLQEHGLDPHEVVYYGKLLKLGTLRGKNWGDKWKTVKAQHGYDNTRSLSKPSKTSESAVPPPPGSAHLDTRFWARRRDNDSFTLHSHQNDTVETKSEPDSDTSVCQYPPTQHKTRVPFTLAPTSKEFGFKTPSTTFTLASAAQLRSVPHPRPRNIRPWDSESSDATELNPPSTSTTPPSYHAAAQDPVTRRHPVVASRSVQIARPLSTPIRITPSRSALVRERRGSVMNEDDAWNKIKILQDEKEADRFREDRLVERCWEVWKQGFQWIHTTHHQIAQARDALLIRSSFQRWRSIGGSHRDLYHRVTILSNNRRQKAAFKAWIIKRKEKKQFDWRNDMRAKMKTIRDTRENKLRNDVWAKWRLSYRARLSGQHFTERLVLRAFNCWKAELYKVDHLEAAADEFQRVSGVKTVDRCWNRWVHVNDVKYAERILVERVGLRVMGEAMGVWMRRAREKHSAKAYHDIILAKATIRLWKAAQVRIRMMENRATKHLARQDDVLVRAVARVWKAHERGKLLERVKAVRLVKDTWAVWKRRLRNQKDLEEMARAFSLRLNCHISSSALQAWHQVYATHRNSLSFACQYYSTQLRYKMLLEWRIHLRAKLKMIKQARLAEKFFVIRKAWRAWTERFEEKTREKKLKALELQRLKKRFGAWLQHSRRERYFKLAEERISKLVTKRMMRTALNQWTNYVIDVKLRELEIKQAHENNLMIIMFKKWKRVCIRHVEELSLMESYQDVKREESIRRMFYRWLSAARSSRHRRLTLQKKEDEMKLSIIAVAWDQWRDRFNDEKLRPIEYAVILQNHKSSIFRAFGAWQAKTKSLPAIQFHSSHTKSKFWKVWRKAIPRALQARKAREMERKIVLGKCLEKWMQSYRIKIAMKAVARARYLRLPTAAPHRAIPPSRSTTNLTTASGSLFHRRAVEPEKAHSDYSGARATRPHAQSTPLVTRTGITRLLGAKTELDVSPRQSRFSARATREPSPARSFGALRTTSPSRPIAKAPSSVGGEGGRSRLWHELREVRQKSRPPTERSHS